MGERRKVKGEHGGNFGAISRERRAPSLMIMQMWIRKKKGERKRASTRQSRGRSQHWKTVKNQRLQKIDLLAHQRAPNQKN